MSSLNHQIIHHFSQRLFQMLALSKSGRRAHRRAKSPVDRRQRASLIRPFSTNAIYFIPKTIFQFVSGLISGKRLSKVSLGLMASIGFVIWTQWHNQLVLSTGAGILAILCVDRLSLSNWQTNLAKLYRFFRIPSVNRQLVLVVGFGSIVTLATYALISLWNESSNHWLVLAVISQFILTIFVLFLLVSQKDQAQPIDAKLLLHQILVNLSNPDPLQRLIAVRQITNLVVNQEVKQLNHLSILPPSSSPLLMQPDGDYVSVLSESKQLSNQVDGYFRLMLKQEPDESVRQAIWESLTILN